MSKQKSNAVVREDASAELLEQVRAAIFPAQLNTFSAGKVYGAHNAVFKLDDKVSTCPSCVRRRVTALKAWHGPQEYRNPETEVREAKDTEQVAEVDTTDALDVNYTDPDADDYVAPVEGTVRLFIEDMAPVDFTASLEDASKGTVQHPTGKGVKAGTYETADGGTLTVAVGNKATYTELS